MDVAALSMAKSQASVSNTVNLTMMKKSMEQMEQNAKQMTEMLKDTSSIIDVKV